MGSSKNACGEAQLFCSLSLPLKEGTYKNMPKPLFPFPLLPCNSEAATVWVCDVAACSATGGLEMVFVCFSVRWESEPSPLGSTMPRTRTAKAALKQSCCLFSLMMPLLQGLFHVALPSHAEHSVGRSLQGQVWDLPWGEGGMRPHCEWFPSLSPRTQREQLPSWRGAPTLLRLQMQGVWMRLSPQWLLCLALSFNVTLAGKSTELKVEKTTSGIPDYGYSVCLTVHKYCM